MTLPLLVALLGMNTSLSSSSSGGGAAEEAADVSSSSSNRSEDDSSHSCGSQSNAPREDGHSQLSPNNTGGVNQSLASSDDLSITGTGDGVNGLGDPIFENHTPYKGKQHAAE